MQRKLFFTVAVFAVVFVTASVVMGQSSVVTKSVSLGEVFKDGGAIGWAIVGLSMIALGLAIDNFVNLRRDKLAPPEVVDEVEALFFDGFGQNALIFAEIEFESARFEHRDGQFVDFVLGKPQSGRNLPNSLPFEPFVAFSEQNQHIFGSLGRNRAKRFGPGQRNNDEVGAQIGFP